jgi:hypothetical protein
MQKTLIAGVLAFGLAMPALAQVQPGQEHTHRDCLAAVADLGQMLENGAEISEAEMQDFEEMQEQASQACDDGRYEEGIQLAEQAKAKLEGGTD